MGSLFAQKKKPINLRWSPAWRRAHKKFKNEATDKKKRVKRAKIVRSIVGFSVEEINKRKNKQYQHQIAQKSEQHEKDLKERKKKEKTAQQKDRKQQQKPISKNVKTYAGTKR